ncbi:MAG: hypothetical protein F4053_12105 [Proteobacteria bacterium]|nr:hypothetical protein [Pseudomonadota bacterium]
MYKWEDKMELFRDSWSGVRRNYRDGFCVSEAGFQADLYERLRQRLQSCNVIAGPTWEGTVDGRRRPDLVIAQDGFITDILELKFVPHWYAIWRPDIQKLRGYLHPNSPRAYPVSLCPETGNWVEDTPLHEECRLHFVVASQHDAAALRRPIPEGEPPVNRWHGPVEDPLPEWHIQFNA